MRYTIIEDDIIQRELLKGLLQELHASVEISEYSNPLQYINDKEAHEPDLFFLDIEMPGMSGVEFLTSHGFTTPVIVISSKKDYAYDVFKFNVSSYLLKPIRKHDLISALNDVSTALRSPNNHIYVKSFGAMHKLLYKEILFIKGAIDYVEIFTTSKKLLVNTSMNQIEKLLPADMFMRVHRSNIVSLDHISSIKNNVVEIKGVELKVSERYKEELIQRVK